MTEFEILVRDTQSQIRAYIAGMGVARDGVDDLAQEVYLEYYRGRDKRPADVEPLRWLKGIAKNLCMNHFRSSKRRAARHLEAVATLLERTPSGVDEHFNPEALDPCLEKLAPKSRDLVTWRYAEGLDSATIGRRLELSAEAVRTTLLRIRASLRDCLEGRAT